MPTSLTHAVIDALLGAAGLGDIGMHFPDSDERYRDADSIELLRAAVALRSRRPGYAIVNVDATVAARAPEARRRTRAMRERLAEALGLEPDAVNVKATTGEGSASSVAARASRRWRSPRCVARPIDELSLRLYDTRTTRRSGAFAPREPGRVGIYACGPTVYARIHIGNARPFVVFSLLEALPRARGLRRHARDQRHRRQRQDLRRRAPAAVSSVELAAEMTGALHRRHRRARRSAGPTTSRSRASRSRRSSRRSQALIAGGHAYAADGDVYFRVRARPGLRRALAPRPRRRWTRARASRAPSARRTRSTSRSGRRTSRARTARWDVALGRGPARLAHRVLGDGRGVARRRLRHPRRRPRPALPPPRERGRPDALPRAGAELARLLDAQRHARSSTARRWRSPSATSPRCTRCSTSHGRDAVVLYFCRRPLPPADRLRRGALAQARAQRRAHPRGRAQAGRRATRRRSLQPLRERFFDALADDFNTPAALAVLWEWIREANRRDAGRPATATCARCSACSGSRTCSTPRGQAPAGGRRAGRSAASRRAPRATSPRADELRDADRGRSAGRSATAPDGFELLPLRDHLRPQPGPGGAARPPRAAASARLVGDGRRRARAVAGGRAASRHRRRREEIERRCGSGAHQGICADAGPYPTSAPTSCSRGASR